MIVLMGAPCVASGGKEVIIQLGIALTKCQMCWCQRRILLSCIVIFIEKQFGFGKYECHFQVGFCRVGQLLNFVVVWEKQGGKGHRLQQRAAVSPVARAWNCSISLLWVCESNCKWVLIWYWVRIKTWIGKVNLKIYIYIYFFFTCKFIFVIF